MHRASRGVIGSGTLLQLLRTSRRQRTPRVHRVCMPSVSQAAPVRSSLGDSRPMSDRPKKIGMVVRRFPVSVLNDIVYCATPIPLELAESIRTLRLEHELSYIDVMWALCESAPDSGQCFGYGKALVELACQCLDDFDPRWK